MTSTIDKDNNDKNPAAQGLPDLINKLEEFAGAESPPTQAATDGVVIATAEARPYNLDTIRRFMDVVFHALPADDAVMTWAVPPTAKPKFPKSEASLMSRLEGSQAPFALYFGTAVCEPDAETGKLRNREKLFKSLHAVVLDDIGTKVAAEDLPQNFPPTYILETSAGNYQYGYVLDEPVTDVEAAKVLVQMVYESGFSDEGGKMPNKLVRMPEGVNGKKGDKLNFVTKLTELHDTHIYTPQQLLDGLDIDARWADVLEDAEAASKARGTRVSGTAAWSPIKPQAAALNGYIDTVLEWMIESDMLLRDNGGEWVDIRCPWGAEHTNGDDMAGYIPAGRGEELTRRAFNCFHDSCSGRKTPELLQFVAANGGPEAPVNDLSIEMTATWVYDYVTPAMWQVRGVRRPRMIKLAASALMFPHKVQVFGYDGKAKFVPQMAVWAASTSRVSVAGAMYDPSTTATIVPTEDNEQVINLYKAPDFTHGKIDQHHVDKFLGFMAYLIPTEDEREFFLDWVAAKIQDPSFRGVAMLMIATTQGIGRSTLADMLTVLLGADNCENVSFTEVIGDGAFNEWIEKPLAIVEETLSGKKEDFYSSYEKLKTLIDPRAKDVTINPKYGMKRRAKVNSSFLFLSNHANALALPANDRRFYAITNPVIAAKPEYFMELNKWLETGTKKLTPDWATHVWRWLQKRDVDLKKQLAPPAQTAAKQEMQDNNRSPIETLIDGTLHVWPTPYITLADVKEVVASLAHHINGEDIKNIDLLTKRLLGTRTVTYDRTVKGRAGGYPNTIRPKLIKAHVERGERAVLPQEAKTANGRLSIFRKINRPDMEQIYEKVTAYLMDNDV